MGDEVIVELRGFPRGRLLILRRGFGCACPRLLRADEACSGEALGELYRHGISPEGSSTGFGDGSDAIGDNIL